MYSLYIMGRILVEMSADIINRVSFIKEKKKVYRVAEVFTEISTLTS